MHLTVAIPTYDRVDVLRASLMHLLPQLNEDCRLLIIDNHSNTPVKDYIDDLLRKHPHVTCDVVRNRCNIGAAANILRCFELCETEWMWLLGDDDHPGPNAIETIIRNVNERRSYHFLHFGTRCYGYAHGHATTGLHEFVEGFDSWGHLNFMSAGVYNIPAIQPHLRFGHNFAYSFSPHTALLLATIGEKGLCWFSDELIIHYQGPAEWSDLNVLLGKMTLLELVSDASIRRKLATKLSLKPSLEAVAVQLTKFCLANRNRDESLFQYDQICSRLYYYDRPFLARLRIAAYRLMVRWPSLGYLGVKTFFPLVKKIAGYQHVDLDQYVSSDRFMRV